MLGRMEEWDFEERVYIDFHFRRILRSDLRGHLEIAAKSAFGPSPFEIVYPVVGRLHVSQSSRSGFSFAKFSFLHIRQENGVSPHSGSGVESPYNKTSKLESSHQSQAGGSSDPGYCVAESSAQGLERSLHAAPDVGTSDDSTLHPLEPAEVSYSFNFDHEVGVSQFLNSTFSGAVSTLCF